jgi:hypothetical protein
MHAARRSMQHNECPLALTIGPNAILHPGAHVGPALTGMTSIRGRCHTFDARADGYLRGEGCGAVVLETARRHDGYGVACPGSSARHNGQSATFTALNGLSQQLLIKAALGDASTTVGNVMEAHGTGTGLGDPIEISSISAIVKKSGHKSCSVCAIKGNVGHTESTAGVANVIEVIGLLKLGEAALNVQLRTLNPQVRQVRAEVLHPSVDTNPMYRDRTQAGGASSFGWSGIIAHGVFQHKRTVEMSSEVCTFAIASLYRKYSLLVRRERQLSSIRRIALAVRSNKVRVGAHEHQADLYCREYRVRVAGWHPSPKSYSENQTALVDSAERELQLDIRPMITQHMSPEAHFSFTEDFSEALQYGFAGSQCNGVTGMLRCTVYQDLSHTPFPQSSISKLEQAKNLLWPQSTLLLSTGEANVGAHNFANQVSPSSVLEAEVQTTRLLGQNMRCI